MLYKESKNLGQSSRFLCDDVSTLANPSTIWLHMLGSQSPRLNFQEPEKDLELKHIELGNPV